MRFKEIFLVLVLSIMFLGNNIEVLGVINYSTSSSHLKGQWNISGPSINLFNKPTHVFLYNGDIIISDSLNNRIKIFNSSDWSLISVIYPFKLVNNNEIKNATAIYQTVEDNDHNFYSLAYNNATLIRYNSSGIINSETQLPDSPLFNTPQYLAIGIDNTQIDSPLLVKYIYNEFSNQSGIFYVGVFTINNVLANNSLRLLMADYHLNSLAQFSYEEEHPVLIGTSLTTSVNFYEFGLINNNYTYMLIKSQNYQAEAFSTFAVAWVNFTQGYWFSNWHTTDPKTNISIGANIITDINLHMVNEIDKITGLGNLSLVDSLAYNKQNDMVIAVSSQQNIIIGMQFSNVSQDILPSIYISFIVISMIIITITFFIVKKRKMMMKK